MNTNKAVYHTKTREEYDWLMQELEKAGCNWLSGEKPTKCDMVGPFASETYIFVSNKELTFETREDYRFCHEGNQYIKVSDLMQPYKDTKGKPKLSLIPPQILFDIAEVREYGNKKYPSDGKDNWKCVDIEDYKDALLRHTLKYLQDPKGKDSESGIEHYKHMACNIAFICEMEAKFK